jgi:large repetitive protein
VVSVHLDGHTGPAPTISALSSHAGPAAGGRSLTLSGTKFSKVTSVYICARKATRVTTLSTTRLRVRAPAGTGAQFVRVFTANGGESALTGQAVYNFLPGPALTGLSPGSGRAAGGTTVTITGTGFGYVTAVYFGSRKGSHVQVISAKEIKVAAPGGSGTVNVRVHTAAGITPVTATDRYTY